jgi:acyl-CoA thioesterase I
MLRLRIAALTLACLASVGVSSLEVRPARAESPPGGAVVEVSSAGPRVVCLGDSLTEGFGLAPEQAWPELLQAQLRKDGWSSIEIVNAGVSGSTSASAVSRLKWQLRNKPAFLVLALGANDGLRGVAVEETRKNLAAAIDLAQASGITVLLAGMKMPPNYGPGFTKQFEEIFPSLAEQKGVALIPFLLETVAADPTLNLPDGIHPNAQGQAVLARTVERYLRPLLEKHAAPSGAAS